MAGPLPQTPTNILGTSTLQVDSGATVTQEFDSGQCYFFEVWVDITTNASATAGTTVSARRKTASGTASPYATNGLTIEVAPNTHSIVYLGSFEAGTVELVITNNDTNTANYYATVNAIWIRTAI